MSTRVIFLFLLLSIFSSGLFSQSKIKSNNPIHYRLLLTSVNIEDVQPDEISITLNAFNTGRNPIDLSEFNSVPEEMEVKFEESFYRSSISSLEGDILNDLISKNIVIPNGKILRNLRFSLPGNETLYKQLTNCLLYTSPSPRDQRGSRMPSSA